MPFAFYGRLSAARKKIYDRSDRITELPIPDGEPLVPHAAAIAEGLERERVPDVRHACQRLMNGLSERFGVPGIRTKVYPARPSGDWGELHGLYLPAEAGGTAVIEVWMRTARRAQVVAPRTFLRTLLHEFCHHLDYEHFGLEETFHTEGFYKRESHLLLQLAGPPRRRGEGAPETPAQGAAGSTTVTGTRGASAQSSS